MDEAYGPLIDAPHAQTMRTYFQGPDQLVVSKQAGQVLPFDGNSFWITRQLGRWYLSTWGPVSYRVPEEANLVALCAEFVGRSKCALPVVPADLVERYGLIQLSEEDYETLCSLLDEPDPNPA